MNRMERTMRFVTRCHVDQSLLRGYLDMHNMDQTMGFKPEHAIAVVYNPVLDLKVARISSKS